MTIEQDKLDRRRAEEQARLHRSNRNDHHSARDNANVRVGRLRSAGDRAGADKAEGEAKAAHDRMIEEESRAEEWENAERQLRERIKEASKTIWRTSAGCSCGGNHKLYSEGAGKPSKDDDLEYTCPKVGCAVPLKHGGWTQDSDGTDVRDMVPVRRA